MQQIEYLRVLAFLAVVGVVFLRAAWVIGRALNARFRGSGEARPIALFDKLVVALAVIGIGCMLYGRFVEPFRLATTTLQIASAKLPAGTGPLRLVHITDTHCDPTVRLEDELPDRIRELRPDVILFTGDSVNSADALPLFKACLSELATIAPTYVIEGNWECWLVPDVGHFDGTGAVELDGEFDTLEVRGLPVQVIGAAMDNPRGIERAALGLDPAVFTVALFHPPYPEVVPPEARGAVDLLLAGHVHGGQVALPFYGALLTLSKHGKKYEEGLYDLDDLWLYVNRGIGMEGGAAPRVRFLSVPEVALIEIVPAE